LNGALETRPNVAAGLEKLESLWNLLFPNATSAQNIDVPEVAVPVAVSGDDRPAQPSIGLLFYYELYSNDNIVYPKIYLPVRLVAHSVRYAGGKFG
jgi:hypothetical protein